MNNSGFWDFLATRLQNIRQTSAAHSGARQLRTELKRLLSVGDHLIEDIELDPEQVREWLEVKRR